MLLKYTTVNPKFMIASEHLIFAGFLLFIASILALDLGIFDRKSHEVKFSEALIWTFVWVGFGIGFYFLLLYFGDRLHGIKTIEDVQQRIDMYKHTYNIIGITDTQQAINIYRHNLALEYITGYLIEYMLSVDNVFVMILVFISFGVHKMYYKRVLMWGIIGAVIMRFIFIFLSAALIKRFDWILYIFGGFLVFTGIKMFVERNKQDKVDPAHHPVVKFVSQYFPVHPVYFRQHFWFRNKYDNYRLYFTPLFLVLLVIEFTDVIFAVDSVPAIFSITQDPYIVFFSNIFAIMGLRSLFFVVAHVISMFRFLKHGLAVLLSFIGFKMLLHVQLTEWGFTTVNSLMVIVAILGISVVASLIWPDPSRKERKDVTALTGEKPI